MGAAQKAGGTYRLSYQILKDEKALSTYGLREGSHQVVALKDGFRIEIKPCLFRNIPRAMRSKFPFDLRVQPDHTVQDVKDRIQQKIHSSRKFELLKDGESEHLKDGEILSDSGITKDSTPALVFKILCESGQLRTRN